MLSNWAMAHEYMYVVFIVCKNATRAELVSIISQFFAHHAIQLTHNIKAIYL